MSPVESFNVLLNIWRQVFQERFAQRKRADAGILRKVSIRWRYFFNSTVHAEPRRWGSLLSQSFGSLFAIKCGRLVKNLPKSDSGIS